MSKRIIYTPDAPAPIGPYQQAVGTGSLLFTAGQIPIDPATGALVEGGVEEQTRRVLLNLSAILTAAGSSLGQVVKTTVFLTDMDDFPAMNKVYASFFAEATAPARSTVQVSRLPKNCRVEIEAVANVPAPG